MTTDPDSILLEGEDAMQKAVAYLAKELQGIRTGRASTSLVEFLKVDYYGSSTDLKSLAAINVSEATTLVIKPFDVGALGEIKKAIEESQLGLNPLSDGKQIRVSVPALSKERRQQLVAHCKKLGEESKVAIRNTRRDANKLADGLKDYPEDDIKTLHNEVQDLLKKYEKQIEEAISKKVTEVEEI